MQLRTRRTDTAKVADQQDKRLWWVECVDAFGRCRAMNVVLDRGRLVVVSPPGQTALLSAHQTRQLGNALDSALDHVHDHRSKITTEAGPPTE
jgi:hypothetical protein